MIEQVCISDHKGPRFYTHADFPLSIGSHPNADIEISSQAGSSGSAFLIVIVNRAYVDTDNSKIKIPLPENVQKTESILRNIGFGSKVDEFELSMNRAAERAAPKAKSIFWDAIKKMTFSDAREILNGQDDAAKRKITER